LGRELSRLAGGSPSERSGEQRAGVRSESALDDDATHLLWLLIEGRTNREIAAELGVGEDVLARRLAEMYAKIGVSTRGEAAVFAFRERVL
jgi:DNA-binding NarL/FixJ family response regulator